MDGRLPWPTSYTKDVFLLMLLLQHSGNASCHCQFSHAGKRVFLMSKFCGQGTSLLKTCFIQQEEGILSQEFCVKILPWFYIYLNLVLLVTYQDWLHTTVTSVIACSYCMHHHFYQWAWQLHITRGTRSVTRLQVIVRPAVTLYGILYSWVPLTVTDVRGF